MPTLPRFNAPLFPEAELGHIRALDSNLSALEHLILELDAALALFDESLKLSMRGSSHRKTLMIWQKIAAREGAMLIYHFGKVWQTIPGLVAASETLRRHVDQAELGKAGKAFETGFPQWALVRKGVAHLGDFMKSEKRRDDHKAVNPEIPGIKGPATWEVYAADNLHNRTYSCTVEGKLVQYDLSRDTVDRLQGILKTVSDALAPAVAAVEARVAEPVQETGPPPKAG